MASRADQLASNLNFSKFGQATELKNRIWFTIGALIPLAMILIPLGNPVIITAISVVVGLFLTGLISAKLGKAPVWPAILRNVLMGSATMAATYLIGLLFGVAVS